MPMTWDAQADARLLQAVIKVYNVKVAGDKLAELAEMMGPDCTAKALTHRISKLKNLANTGALSSAAGGGEKTATPKGRKATGAGSKTAASGGAVRGGDSGEDDGEEETLSKKTGRVKGRKRKSDTDLDEADKALKKIKAEDEAGDFDFF